MKTLFTFCIALLSLTLSAQDYSTCFAGHCESGTITLSELVGVTSIEVNQSNPDSQAEVASFTLSVGSKKCSSDDMNLSEKCLERLKNTAVGDEIKIYDIVVVVDEPTGLTAKAGGLTLSVVDNP